MNLKKSRFTAMLIEANGIDPDDFQSWVFSPGMQFNSPVKWWGDHGRRDFPHEGIDICLYEDRSGRLRRLNAETLIPVMYDGVVKALFNDYLGQALIIEHQRTQAGNERFLAAYAHTKPQVGIQSGTVVKAGDIIATIADTRQSKAKILPHLHFSLGRPAPGMIYEPFVWDIMRDPDRVALLEPAGTLDWPCRILKSPYSNEFG